MNIIFFIRNSRAWIFIPIITLLSVPAGYCDPQSHKPRQLTYRIVQEFPHDPQAFTQGLAWDDGNAYEGTGLYGKSSLRRVDLKTGNVELQFDYDQEFFAEGITVYEDKIYQLTWKNNRIFKYDKHDFSLIGSSNFPYEGWGITHDGGQLIVSDGTARLYFIDPKTLLEQRRIFVHDDQGQVNQLNELEFINGKIYANIWQKDQIAIINPEDGIVTGYLDLGGLTTLMKSESKLNVLNGIMFDPVGERIFVTGKLWPRLYEIKIVPVPL